MNSTMEKATAKDLKSIVSQWVDKSFNYVDLANAEKVFDNELFEHIESNCTEETAETFILDYGYTDEFKESECESALDFVNENYEDEFQEYAETDHYPMWSTLFEFRNRPSEGVIEAARQAGFGIISESDYFSTMLFVKGAGYSFYSAHWIPMYLGLPWVDKIEFEGIDYSMI